MESEAHPVRLSQHIAVPDSWRWERLDSVCAGVYDCPHSTPRLTENGPYLARSQDMRSGVFRLEVAARVSDETYRERIARAEPRHGDLLYSREGTYFGIAAEVPRNVRVCLGQRMVLIRPEPAIVDARFLLNWLNSPALKEHARGHRDGSVAERLNLPTIRALPIAVPQLVEQRAIVNILGALDDKIELNRRVNATLEAMARALYDSWFVRFDPVRANAEARSSHLPEHLANLFPNSFEDSELGEIPADWKVQPFADTVEVIGGGTPNTSVAEYWCGDIPWFSVVDAPPEADVWVVDTSKKVTRAGVENSSARILPIGATIISARGTVGRIALVGVPMAVNQSCYGLTRRSDAQDLFTYFTTRDLVSTLQRHAHGSVFDTITRDTLSRVSVVVPPPRLVEAFEDRAGPILGRVRTGLFESLTLTGLRDALLPKLISGELRVVEAERLLAADPK